MTTRERWRIILILIRFLMEANDTELITVAELAAHTMTNRIQPEEA